MVWIVCVLLSAAGFYVSIGLGEAWPLAWLAPIPVLWLAMGSARATPALAAAFSAYAIAGCNLLPAYWGVLPPVVLLLAVCGPALLFALAVAGARIAHRRQAPLMCVLTFAALWAGFDFLLAFDPAGGSVLTPAASQVSMPALIQIASVSGFSGVTFLLGACAGAFAAALRHRSFGMALFGLAVFVGNAGFGVWRMSAPSSESLRVALIASDTAVGEIWKADEPSAQEVIAAYASQVRGLEGAGVDLIILPENLMRIDTAWRDSVLAPLVQAAGAADADIIAGFNTELRGAQRNVAWVARTDGQTFFYEKRQLVPELETQIYTRGDKALTLPDGIMVVICKDLDFPAMIRADAAASNPVLIAAPAWDFGRDGWGHARIAILRGVENGVAVARSARYGMLTLTDRYGRIIAQGQSADTFRIVVGELPLGAAKNITPYRRMGGLFGWMCVLFGAVSTAFAAYATRRKSPIQRSGSTVE